jgi:putative ABC transport system permease protein
MGIMGRALLIGRLAVRDLRRHAAQAVLLLVAITAATTVLTLGLALHGVTSHPYQQTRAATRGPDVVAELPVSPRPGQEARTAAALDRLPGVTGDSGPYPVTSAILRAGGRTAGVEAEGRTPAPAAVDQPRLTAGRWVRAGGVVVERTFAQALGVSVGARVTLNGRAFTVAGVAVTAASAPYPNLCYSSAGGCAASGEAGPGNIGLIWMTEPDAVRLASAASPVDAYIVNLRLRDPARAQALASAYDRAHPAASAPVLTAWPGIAAADALLVQDEQQVLAPGAWLLGLLAAASVAVLVGGRLAEQTRRVGLIKAVGGTPGLVAAAYLAENLILALAAAAAGLLAGWLAAPLITSPGVALVGTPGAPSLTLGMAAEVTALALGAALAATLIPAIRAARASTISALNDAARPPRRRRALISISRRLPVPLLLGLRLVARRPRRALLSAASTAVTVTGIVAVLAFHAAAGEKRFGGSSALVSPVAARDEQVLLVLTIMLVTLAALNAIVTAWATVLDARRASALARALGARSRQVSGALAAAQVLAALPGAIVGVPAGIALFGAANGTGIVTAPPAAWLIAAVLGTLLAVAALTAIPARIAARIPPAQVLQSEAA